jgi:hypothetical protein
MADEMLEAQVTLLDGKVADAADALAALRKDVTALGSELSETVLDRLKWIDARLDRLELLIGALGAAKPR